MQVLTTVSFCTDMEKMDCIDSQGRMKKLLWLMREITWMSHVTKWKYFQVTKRPGPERRMKDRVET